MAFSFKVFALAKRGDLSRLCPSAILCVNRFLYVFEEIPIINTTGKSKIDIVQEALKFYRFYERMRLPSNAKRGVN